MKRIIGITVILLYCGIALKGYDFSVNGIYYNIRRGDSLCVEVTYEKIEDIRDSRIMTYKESLTQPVGKPEDTYSGDLIIPSSVEYMGQTYQVVRIGSLAFHDCIHLKSVIIPESVKTIGFRAFNTCKNLEFIQLPDSLTKISSMAFASCNRLKKIKLPDMVSFIGGNAFVACDKIDTIIVPRSLEHIGNFVFDNCKNLQSVTLPETVKIIGHHAFDGRSLKEIHCKVVAPPSLLYAAFANVDLANCILYVPKGTAEAYRNSFTEWGDGWGLFKNIVEEE